MTPSKDHCRTSTGQTKLSESNVLRSIPITLLLLRCGDVALAGAWRLRFGEDALTGALYWGNGRKRTRQVQNFIKNALTECDFCHRLWGFS